MTKIVRRSIHPAVDVGYADYAEWPLDNNEKAIVLHCSYDLKDTSSCFLNLFMHLGFH